jgi:hypothetical protein
MGSIFTTSTTPTQPTSSNKRALLIGINYYSDPRLRLSGCVSDAERMHNFLLKQGYADENILVLKDSPYSSRSIKPKRKNIVRAIEWLLSSSKNDDFHHNEGFEDRDTTVSYQYFFHYSGHGSSVKDLDGDELDGMDETICPCDVIKNGQIRDDEIRQMLIDRISDNSRMWSIMDCCHSGSCMDLKYISRIVDQETGIVINTHTSEDTQASIQCLSGCMDDQTSLDMNIDGVNTGLLTAAFLHTMKAVNKSKQSITYKDLLRRIHLFVMSKRVYSQSPTLSFGKLESYDDQVLF